MWLSDVAFQRQTQHACDILRVLALMLVWVLMHALRLCPHEGDCRQE